MEKDSFTNVRKIDENNIEDAFKLMQSNTYFYSRTQSHILTLDECREDITALPPKVDLEQKFFMGFYKGDDMIAVLDYVEGYPNENVLYLGFFMLHMDKHEKGIGRQIINTFIKTTKNNNFAEIKLACYETNEIGYLFWSKMGFSVEKMSKKVVDGRKYNLVEMHITLKSKINP
ncbi:GNAT family N-acetyltransferase [Clostridium sp. D2Q-14]|uniref:GNAT family N-acetyltransferase n=1 Tax=Anaeromonas gelatinilytica TaxID=2683194 RepID=UPI00193B712A|nr:GNAT family N-acetyltransferase [Anaeromonas gelatinilytica]MBS4535329.1 GNAT family N-acetyltransferase [Anaeromonas gelatinilytica]